MPAGVYRVKKKALNLLELELYVAMSHLTWKLGSKFGSFTRPICAISHRVILAAPETDILVHVLVCAHACRS